MSIPGIADQTSGEIVYVPYFQWSNWDIGRKITEQTGANVVIENDANAVALAELWFGNDEIKRMRNFIMVFVAEGIGSRVPDLQETLAFSLINFLESPRE